MKKFFRNYIIILLSILSIFTCITYYPKAFSDIDIVPDSSKTNTLPRNLRKTTDLSLASNLKSLDLTGLDKLNISGSGQFTSFDIPLLKTYIGENLSIIDIDLREESHGFADGIAISFKNDNNNANAGLSYDEVIYMENKDLASIKLNEPLTLSNKDLIIIPKKVQNELDVAKENNISYLRIPVTDGGLPKEDMVNYFVDFVKNQPKDSWLHFHCKAGIGRTSTFMIMYDIIKNCNKVSLNDIIGRQLLLANLSQENIIDFYLERRYSFLNDFYNKCMNNEYNLFSSNSNNSISLMANTIISDDMIDSSYVKNKLSPKFLYVISEKDMTREEQTMIATLQGLVASKSNNQIYVLSAGEPDYEVWLNDLKSNYNVKYKKIKNPWKLVNEFKEYIYGYVLYNEAMLPSINNACTLASLKNGIAINESIEDTLNKNGVTNLIKDCRNTDSSWAFNNLWNDGLNHSIVIEISPDKTLALRDYAMISKSLIFYEDSVENSSLRDMIFESMDDNGHCLGWGPDEHTNVSIASKHGIDVIAADWSYNLSILSSYKSSPQKQKSNNEFKEEDNVHYVSIVMSDGDNQQWLLGNSYNSKDWFGSKHRGHFNLGWSISPSIYHLAPTVFNKYYTSASNSDNFIVPASGNGYMYPSKFPVDKLGNYTQILNSYMKLVDQRYSLILDDEVFYRKDLWNKYTSQPNIDGLIYLNYNINSKYDGKIIWSNDKPIVSCRDLLWSGLEDEDTFIQKINDRVNLGYTNIKDPNSYTLLYIHVWSKDMDNVNYVVNNLNKNSKVRIVTPDVFMDLIKNNIPHIDL